MRNLVIGMVVGTGFGYAFHTNIDEVLRTFLNRANEVIGDPGVTTP